MPQVPGLVASYQANFVDCTLFFMMCAIASGAGPASCLTASCARVNSAESCQHLKACYLLCEAVCLLGVAC